jgi:hypothetical protein
MAGMVLAGIGAAIVPALESAGAAGKDGTGGGTKNAEKSIEIGTKNAEKSIEIGAKIDTTIDVNNQRLVE